MNPPLAEELKAPTGDSPPQVTDTDETGFNLKHFSRVYQFYVDILVSYICITKFNMKNMKLISYVDSIECKLCINSLVINACPKFAWHFNLHACCRFNILRL